MPVAVSIWLRRRSTLAATVLDTTTRLTDDRGLFNRAVGCMFRRAEARAVNDKVRLLAKLQRRVDQGERVWRRSRRGGRVQGGRLAASVADAERLARPDKVDLQALARRAWPVTHRLDGPRHVSVDTLEDVRIKDCEMKVTPLKPITTEAAEDAAGRLHGMLPNARVTNVLAEVHGRTGFANAFTHLHTGMPLKIRASC